MREYDVIIVGCGPAGIASAKLLKQAKISFCIIEKNKFPREKLCGGGLTHKTATLLNKFGLNLNGIKTFFCDSAMLVNKKVNRILKLGNDIIMVDRLEFDYNNFKQLNDIDIFEEENIKEIDDNILITDKRKYKFKYIIFADGVNGYSRKLIDNREFGFCLEYNTNQIFNKAILDFSVIDYGYGWIFPKKDFITIGVGKFNSKKINYLKALNLFANKYNVNLEDKSKIRGYNIPVYNKNIFKKSVILNKYILVGDAASLVDPVSGEGIYYALVSGMMAAESIILSIKRGDRLDKIYFKKMRKVYFSLNIRKFLSKLLYSKYRDIFIKIGLSNKLYINILNKLFG